jgi:hypothetical protein
MENNDDLLNSFKTAANSLALMYRDAQAHAQKAQDKGYSKALADLADFIAKAPGAAISKADMLRFITLKQTDVGGTSEAISNFHMNSPPKESLFSHPQLNSAHYDSKAAPDPLFDTGARVSSGNPATATSFQRVDSAPSIANFNPLLAQILPQFPMHPQYRPFVERGLESRVDKSINSERSLDSKRRYADLHSEGSILRDGMRDDHYYSSLEAHEIKRMRRDDMSE